MSDLRPWPLAHLALRSPLPLLRSDRLLHALPSHLIHRIACSLHRRLLQPAVPSHRIGVPPVFERVVRSAAAASAQRWSAAKPHLLLAASCPAFSSSRILPMAPSLPLLLFLSLSFREPAPASAVSRAWGGSVPAIASLLPAAAPARAAVHVTILFVFVILLCPVSALLPPRLRSPPRHPALPKVRRGAG